MTTPTRASILAVDDMLISFGALVPLPAGYVVFWSEGHEHYQALGPNDWESPITCDKHQARRWCFMRAAEEVAP